MTADEILQSVVAKPTPAERAEYLDRVCGNDAGMRALVEGLIASLDKAGSFLEQPLFETSATIDAPLHPESLGTVIGPYKLMEQIGEGGMGLVYVAEQHHPVRRKVALKLIKPGMDTRQVIARFEAERQALALMNHANIARVFDGGETPSGRPYFVMELVKGVPITEYCDQNRLTPRARLELFRQVCAAVQHAHQKGIIHRDIKPSNVIVSSHDGTPVVKVIDFGVAKAIGQQLSEKTVYTQVSQFIGTPLYMSPEQAGQSDLDIDTRTDVYALGVLLYELLTGTTPFDKDRLKDANYDEIRRIIREEDPPKPSTRMSTLNQQAGSTVSAERQIAPRALSLLLRGELDWIVMKSLEKDRNRRYGSASDLEADIERFLKDQPVHACPPSRRYLLGKFMRRNRRNLLTTSAFLAAALALIVGGGYWFWSRAATIDAVERDWAEAENFWKEKQWAKALPALERASGRLAGSGLTALQAKVDARRRDVAMVARLDSAVTQIIFDSNVRDWSGAQKSHQSAFADYGLDAMALGKEETAQRIRASEIRNELIRGLDQWAYCTDRIPGATGQWLRDIAQLADDDPWRIRLRELHLTKDRAELVRLAEAKEAAAQPQDNVERLVDLLEDVGAHEAALRLQRKAQELNPGNVWLNYNLWRLLNDKPESAAEALGFLRAAMALKPESPSMHTALALALGKQGKRAEADRALRRALELKPDHGFTHTVLGDSLLVQRKWREAEAAFREAIALRPDLARAHNGLGIALSSQGDPEGAAAAYRMAIVSNPKLFEPHANLGAILRNEGRLVEAEAHYQKALDLQPNNQQLIADVDRFRKQAANLLNGRFVQSWLVLSELLPYEGKDGAKALDGEQIPGEAGLRSRAGDRIDVNGKTFEWKEYHSPEVMVDFTVACGGPSEFRVAYGVCYVHADADRADLTLCVGSDDQAMVYLNGIAIHRQRAARSLELDEDKISPVTLRKGPNVLVFKVVNQGGRGPFGSLRFLTKDGDVPEGIEFRLSP